MTLTGALMARHGGRRAGDPRGDDRRLADDLGEMYIAPEFGEAEADR